MEIDGYLVAGGVGIEVEFQEWILICLLHKKICAVGNAGIAVNGIAGNAGQVAGHHAVQRIVGAVHGYRIGSVCGTRYGCAVMVVPLVNRCRPFKAHFRHPGYDLAEVRYGIAVRGVDGNYRGYGGQYHHGMAAHSGISQGANGRVVAGKGAAHHICVGNCRNEGVAATGHSTRNAPYISRCRAAQHRDSRKRYRLTGTDDSR